MMGGMGGGMMGGGGFNPYMGGGMGGGFNPYASGMGGGMGMNPYMGGGYGGGFNPYAGGFGGGMGGGYQQNMQQRLQQMLSGMPQQGTEEIPAVEAPPNGERVGTELPPPQEVLPAEQVDPAAPATGPGRLPYAPASGYGSGYAKQLEEMMRQQGQWQSGGGQQPAQPGVPPAQSGPQGMYMDPEQMKKMIAGGHYDQGLLENWGDPNFKMLSESANRFDASDRPGFDPRVAMAYNHMPDEVWNDHARRNAYTSGLLGYQSNNANMAGYRQAGSPESEGGTPEAYHGFWGTPIRARSARSGW